MKIISKAIAIPILTAPSLDVVNSIAVRIGIPNALEFTYFHFITTVGLELYFNLFPYYLIPNFFAYFSTFDSFVLSLNGNFLKSFQCM